MRFSLFTACVYSGARRQTPLQSWCRYHGQDACRQQRFYTLGEYLQRLPRGIRDLLLWSPAIAAAYFMLYKQAVYFLPSMGRQLLSRPITPATEPSDRSTDKAQGSGELRAVKVRMDNACGSVVDGLLLPLVDREEAAAVASSSLSPPIPPFSTGAMMDAMPLRAVRDVDTGKVSGYTRP
ncbi:hypothetical protein BCY84_10661 [Trypanosoma cruzi cruzi]|nr:hypothetical protein BCY84_10661 [Trypanosoma cruzi cruzi]